MQKKGMSERTDPCAHSAWLTAYLLISVLVLFGRLRVVVASTALDVTKPPNLEGWQPLGRFERTKQVFDTLEGLVFRNSIAAAKVIKRPLFGAD